MAEGLEARIRRLEDIEAIRQLKARYCQACDDDHNPDAVAACFAEDGLWEGPGIGVHARGHAAIKRYIGGVRASGRVRASAHMVTNPIIDVMGDQALGAWRLLMLYSSVEADGTVTFHRIIGHYEDQFARVGDVWLFKVLRVTVVAAGSYAAENGALR